MQRSQNRVRLAVYCIENLVFILLIILLLISELGVPTKELGVSQGAWRRGVWKSLTDEGTGEHLL